MQLAVVAVVVVGGVGIVFQLLLIIMILQLVAVRWFNLFGRSFVGVVLFVSFLCFSSCFVVNKQLSSWNTLRPVAILFRFVVPVFGHSLLCCCFVAIYMMYIYAVVWCDVVVVVIVVLTLTRIIKFAVTGQAPVTLELRNTPAKKHEHIDYMVSFFHDNMIV